MGWQRAHSRAKMSNVSLACDVRWSRVRSRVVGQESLCGGGPQSGVPRGDIAKADLARRARSRRGYFPREAEGVPEGGPPGPPGSPNRT